MGSSDSSVFGFQGLRGLRLRLGIESLGLKLRASGS